MALPNDSIFNTRIDNLPLDVNSGTRTAHILNGTTTYFQFEIDFPMNLYSSTSLTSNATFFYTTLANGTPIKYNPWPYTGTEHSITPADYFAQDRHMLGVSTDTCRFQDIYNFYPVGTNVTQCATCNAQSGYFYDGASYALPTLGAGGGATDAAGMQIADLAIGYDELKAGVIRHALRYTMDNGDNDTSFLWPATQFATGASCGAGANKCIPYGSRWRLKSSFPISNFSATTQTILTALKQYGMFMVDGGTALHSQCWTDVRADSVTWAAIDSEIRSTTTITQFQFEQVDESSLMVLSTSSKVNLTNGFVTPDNYVEVVATDTVNASTVGVRVALMPVTIGIQNLPFPPNSNVLSVMAGTPQFQIPYWVNGSNTKTATCTMTPTIGTLSTDCKYTAPTAAAFATGVATTTIVTIKADADVTNGAINFPITVFPADGVRINAGGKSLANAPTPPYDANGNYGPDVNGKMWSSDPVGNQPPFYAKDDNFNPQSSWISSTTTSDIALWYTDSHANEDGAYSMMVPNGRYLLNIGFGSSDSNLVANSSATIDTQSLVIVTTATAIIPAIYTPYSFSRVVWVTNNQFYWALREIYSTAFTIINKWSLTPLSTTSVIVR